MQKVQQDYREKLRANKKPLSVSINIWADEVLAALKVRGDANEVQRQLARIGPEGVAEQLSKNFEERFGVFVPPPILEHKLPFFFPFNLKHEEDLLSGDLTTYHVRKRFPAQFNGSPPKEGLWEGVRERAYASEQLSQEELEKMKASLYIQVVLFALFVEERFK